MPFSDLTERQNQLLGKLLDHESRVGHANEEFNAIDFTQGWRINVRGYSELIDGFSETDLLALHSLGYIMLQKTKRGYNLTMTARAYSCRDAGGPLGSVPTSRVKRATAVSAVDSGVLAQQVSPAMSLQLHDDIKRSLTTGNVCAFVGAGLSIGAGLPSWYDLTAELAALVGYKLAPREWASGDALIDAAQAFVNKQGLHRLISHLKDRLDTTKVQPTAAHRALAWLPISLVFTANFDDLLERAFHDAGKRVEVVTRDSMIPFMRREPGVVNVVKLYGDLNQPDTIVLARQQYESYFLERPQMVKMLETELARSDTLYLGWSGGDPYFKLIFGELLSHFGRMMRPGYAVLFDVTEAQRDELARKQIRLVELPTGDRTQQLAEWLRGLALPAAGQPFVLPNSVRDQDVGITPGREVSTTRNEGCLVVKVEEQPPSSELVYGHIWKRLEVANPGAVEVTDCLARVVSVERLGSVIDPSLGQRLPNFAPGWLSWVPEQFQPITIMPESTAILDLLLKLPNHPLRVALSLERGVVREMKHIGTRTDCLALRDAGRYLIRVSIESTALPPLEKCYTFYWDGGHKDFPVEEVRSDAPSDASQAPRSPSSGEAARRSATMIVPTDVGSIEGVLKAIVKRTGSRSSDRLHLFAVLPRTHDDAADTLHIAMWLNDPNQIVGTVTLPVEPVENLGLLVSDLEDDDQNLSQPLAVETFHKVRHEEVLDAIVCSFLDLGGARTEVFLTFKHPVARDYCTVIIREILKRFPDTKVESEDATIAGI